MNNEDVEIGVWVRIFVVCIFGLGTAVGFFIFFSGNSVFTKASGEQASLQFSPNSISAHKGETVKVQVMLDTNKAQIRGTDVMMKFDPTLLTLNRLIPTAQKYTELKTYLPLDEYQNFDNWKVISRANSEGIIEFSAITADIPNNKLLKTISGNLAIAELEFIMKKEGTTKVEFLKSHPTHDSTVVQDINPPINILTRTNTLILSTQPLTPTP